MKIHITLVGGQPLATMPIMATRPERVPYVCSKGSEGTFATYHPMNGAAKEKCEGYNIPTYSKKVLLFSLPFDIYCSHVEKCSYLCRTFPKGRRCLLPVLKK